MQLTESGNFFAISLLISFSTGDTEHNKQVE